MRILWSLTVVIYLLILFACAGSKSKSSQTPMMNSYEDLWKKVESKDQEGLPQSALAIVDSISAMANREGNVNQQIKAFIHRAKYSSLLDEAGLKKGIVLFEADLKSNQDPILRSILHSLIAQLYQQYLDLNIWVIRGRTIVYNNQDPNFENWAQSDFLKTIRMHYVASFQAPQLKTASVKDFSAILTEGKASDSLRPYLYDILAHRALDYFMNSRSDLDLVEDDFVFDHPVLFAHTDQFVHFNAGTPKDSISFYKTILKTFQELEAFHRNDPLPAAWIDVVQKRIQFVYDHYSAPDKAILFEVALDQWISTTASTRSNAPFLLRKANLYTELGHQYQSGNADSAYRRHLVKAVELFELLSNGYKNTTEAKQAENARLTLLQPALNGQAEQVNPREHPFRILVSYRNVSKVYIKVIPVDLAMRHKISQMRPEETLNQILGIKAIQSFSQNLPASEDLQQHQAELKVDGIPSGLYTILLSDKEVFSKGDGTMAVLYTHVSDLAYLHSFNQYYYSNAERLNQPKELFVVDRQLGSPIQGVRATFYENQYNPTSQKYQWIKINEKNSDVQGRIIPELPSNRNFSVQLSKGDDHLWLEDGFSNSSYSEGNNKETTDLVFFLDRSLYRPGQLIYFKGLALARDVTGNPRILKNRKVAISLSDANGQLVISKSFTTNDFGTIHGSFTAPVSGLMGSMSLVSDLDHASVQFQVEEYKRPKFEVQFDTNKVVNRLNEAITLTGFAKNFAGNVVDQSKVYYKVSRARFIRPMPWWGWKGFFPSYSEPQIITQGVTTTDAMGKFIIPFTALPEPNVDLTKDELSFVYSVDVDVTDFTGETRSAHTSLRIGTKNLVLSSSLLPSEIKDSLKEIRISATDLNGTPVVTTGTFSIYKLKAAERMFRERYWDTPDQFIFSESDYHKWFPTDIYKDEHLVMNWPISQTIRTGSFDSQKPADLRQLTEPGIYKLVAMAKDKYQQTTIYEHYFWVTDPVRGVFALNEPLAFYQSSTVLQPGQASNYTLRTIPIPQHVLQTSTHTKQSQWVINSGVIQDRIILTEKDRGIMHQNQWYMIRDNRLYTKQMSYGITWENKDIQIQTISFRDKLLPGQNESWSLKVSGKEKDKFITEIVASMYDQSLDALYPHEWRRDIFRMNYLPGSNYMGVGFHAVSPYFMDSRPLPYVEIDPVQYRDLNWFGFNVYGGGMYDTRGGKVMKSRNAMPQASDMVLQSERAEAAAPPAGKANEVNVLKDEETAHDVLKPISPPVRKNLDETVFFFPDLKTDTDGNFILKFKMNEALTRWRLMLFGHTQDLKSGYLEKEILTQKDLMVFPNAPRFVRQGDRLEFPAKVANLRATELYGVARLELFDPLTNQSLLKEFQVTAVQSSFHIPGGQSSPLVWSVKVPEDYIGMLGYRVLAESGNVLDGEENVIPVLSNRLLVTEPMPFQVKANQTKSFVFSELLSKSKSTTLRHHSYVLECTSNPAWYAIQALPYMMEYPHECTEQLVNRFYANALAAHIIQVNPHIKTIFDGWNKSGDLKSPLSKNEELKTALLAETPWVKEAISEEEQQKMIALLFDLNKTASEKQRVMDVLRNRQLSNGGFPWFEGRDDWYITQYILESLGHLTKLGVVDDELDDVTQKAIVYCDRELSKYFEELKKNTKREDIGLPEIAVHYLYTRSFYTSIEIENKSAFTYFVQEAEKVWLKQSLYAQGMIALALHRWKPASQVPDKILASLSERAQHSDELGMYWKFESGYRWFELPIETQALLIEAFSELKPSAETAVDDMLIWLLKNKQTNRWSSTKSTSAAIYALLLHGKSWIGESKVPVMKWGSDPVSIQKDQIVPGLGYFKIKKEASAITSSLANLTVSNPNNHIVWGAAYWQYFEDLDKITSFKTTPIAINKQLFIERIEGNKTILKPFTTLNVGDKLVIRVEIKVDRPMDYVHLKDMRAAGLEPIQVISQYKYQGGLGYYESTKDQATHFFFDHIYPGTFVLEYPLRVTQRGIFSNGISTMECMYAPEFSTHSKGETLTIK